jgi:hypothetical protein
MIAKAAAAAGILQPSSSDKLMDSSSAALTFEA